MKVRRGDVVLIDHPFSDATGSKVRPALVVQSDARNSRLSETIVALISKNLAHIATDKTQLFIDIGTTDGRASGLNIDSALKCGKLFTVDDHLVRKKIGTFSPSLMSQANACLTLALELP